MLDAVAGVDVADAAIGQHALDHTMILCRSDASEPRMPTATFQDSSGSCS